MTSPHFSPAFGFKRLFRSASSFSTLSVLDLYTYRAAEDRACGLEAEQTIAIKTDCFEQ